MNQWQDLANCKGKEQSDDFFSDEHQVRKQAAKDLCTDCPVRFLCLQEGFDYRERFGVRGGFDQSKLREAQHMDALGRAATSVIYSTRCLFCDTVIPLNNKVTQEVTCPDCGMIWEVQFK